MMYIFVIIGRMYCYHFKCNDLKKQKHFAAFYCIFRIYIKFRTFSKKKKKKKIPQLKHKSPSGISMLNSIFASVQQEPNPLSAFILDLKYFYVTHCRD